MNTRTWALAGAAGVAWLFGTAWVLGGRTPVPDPVPATDAVVTIERAEARGGPGVALPATAPPTAVPPTEVERLLARYRESSLRGTEPDGELAFDGNGQLRLDAGLRRLFEYVHSLIGEFGEPELGRLLYALVAERHGDAAAVAALAAFDRYAQFRRELAALPAEPDPSLRLAQRQALQRAWFGEHAEAMFGDDDAYDAYTAARLAALHDPTLDATARTERLAELEAALPPALREQQREATSAALAEEQTRQFDALDLGSAERHAERSALWGEQAADRLAALDAERAAWTQRLDDYAAARARVLADPSLDAAARERALQALVEQRFDPRERLRVEAMQAAGLLAPRPGG